MLKARTRYLYDLLATTVVSENEVTSTPTSAICFQLPLPVARSMRKPASSLPLSSQATSTSVAPFGAPPASRARLPPGSSG